MENLNKYLNQEIELGNVKFIRESEQRDYYVSKQGDIYSMSKLTGSTRKVKITKNDRGYLQVKIGKKNNKVHRLVAEAFLNDYSIDLQVNHIDFNKQNNSLDNLEMCSMYENIRHQFTGCLTDYPFSIVEMKAIEHYLSDSNKEQVASLIELNKSIELFMSDSETL